jgi:hypothetical protein
MACVDGLRTRSASLTWQREDKWFANSEGALTAQTLIESSCGIKATGEDLLPPALKRLADCLVPPA